MSTRDDLVGTKKQRIKEFIRIIDKRNKRDRSYKKFQTFQNIDILEQDRKNRADLMTRLRTVTGAIEQDPEMQNFIKSKLKSHSQPFKQNPQAKKENISEKILEQILTPEEKRIVKMLLSGSWHLNHVTQYYKTIKAQGNVLLSLDERRRRGEQPKNANTTPMEGSTDFVFWTYGPGAIETVNFLEEARHVVKVDYDILMENNPQSLFGLWNSEHLYAFLAEQTGEQPKSVNIFDTLYTESYQQMTPSQTSQIQMETKSNAERAANIVKYCRFERPNGSVIIQHMDKHEEIFVHPRIDLALCLKTIEKIRLLGKPAWEKLMSMQTDFSPRPRNATEELAYATYLQLLQSIVQAFFHPGTAEAHQPAEFALDQPGVRVIERQPKSLTLEANPEETALLKPLINAALEGNAEFVIPKLHSKLPLNKRIVFGMQEINLLGAAILGRSIALIAALLKQGVDLRSTQVLQFTANSSTGFSSIELVFGLTNIAWVQFIMKNLGKSMEMDQKTLSETALAGLKLFLKQGSAYHGNPNITRVDHIGEPEFERILRMRPDPGIILEALSLTHFRSKHMGLSFAVALNSPELIRALCQRGAEIDERVDNKYALKDSPYFQELPRGYTTLIAAVKQRSILMVEVLLQLRANVNLPLFMEQNGKTPDALVVQEEEGFTPLMFAIQAGNQEMVKMLLTAGAVVGHCSAKGHTAKSIATKTLPEILPLLSKFETRNDSLLAPKKPEELLQAQAQVLAKNFKIQKHSMSTIIMLRNEHNEPFFLLEYEEEDLKAGEKPVVTFRKDALPHFTRQQCEEDLSCIYLGHTFKTDAINWKALGLVSYDHPEASVHYATGFMLADCPAELSTKILQTVQAVFEGLMLVSVAQLQEARKQFHESDEVVLLDNCAIASNDFQILTLLLQDSKNVTIDPQRWNSFQTKVQDCYRYRYELLTAIRSGNRDRVNQLAEILEAQKLGNLDFVVDTFEPISHRTQRDDHTRVATRTVTDATLKTLSPLESAFEEAQYDIALDLISRGAKFLNSDVSTVYIGRLVLNLSQENCQSSIAVTALRLKLFEKYLQELSGAVDHPNASIHTKYITDTLMLRSLSLYGIYEFKIAVINLIIDNFRDKINNDRLLIAACYNFSVESIKKYFPLVSKSAQQATLAAVLCAYYFYLQENPDQKEIKEKNEMIRNILVFLKTQKQVDPKCFKLTTFHFDDVISQVSFSEIKIFDISLIEEMRPMLHDLDADDCRELDSFLGNARLPHSGGIQQPAMIFSTKPVGASPRPLSASPAKKSSPAKPVSDQKPKPEKKETKRDKP